MAKFGGCAAPAGFRITHDCKGSFTNPFGKTITCDCTCHQREETTDDTA